MSAGLQQDCVSALQYTYGTHMYCRWNPLGNTIRGIHLGVFSSSFSSLGRATSDTKIDQVTISGWEAETVVGFSKGGKKIAGCNRQQTFLSPTTLLERTDCPVSEGPVNSVCTTLQSLSYIPSSRKPPGREAGKEQARDGTEKQRSF